MLPVRIGSKVWLVLLQVLLSPREGGLQVFLYLGCKNLVSGASASSCDMEMPARVFFVLRRDPY